MRDLLRGAAAAQRSHPALGCGDSDLARDLDLDGFPHITNIDLSGACIAAQRVRNADCPGMEWRVLLLPAHFSLSSFDVVLHKCTLDALVVVECDVWDPREEVQRQMDQVLTGVSRLLRPDGGVYVQLSFGQPVHRMEHDLDKVKYGWNCTVDTEQRRRLRLQLLPKHHAAHDRHAGVGALQGQGHGGQKLLFVLHAHSLTTAPMYGQF